MRRTLAAAALVALAADASGQDAASEARRCWSTVGEAAVMACRRALELGPPPARGARLELTLSARLGALGRWSEAADVHRAAIARRPKDAEAHRRLGAVLLHGLGRHTEAEAALRDAIRLGSDEARTHGDLALALVALRRHGDAVAAFEAAVRLDPGYLKARPGSRAAYEAAKAGRPWPDASPPA